MHDRYIVCVDTILSVWSAVYQYLKYTRNRHFARMKKNVLRDAPVEEQQVIAAHSKGSSPFVGEAAVKYLTRQTSFIKLWREIRHVNYAANVIMLLFWNHFSKSKRWKYGSQPLREKLDPAMREFAIDTALLLIQTSATRRSFVEGLVYICVKFRSVKEANDHTEAALKILDEPRLAFNELYSAEQSRWNRSCFRWNPFRI